MNIAEKILSKLSEWEVTGVGRHELTVPLEGTPWTGHVAADRVDSLSCLLWELSLTRGSAGTADLKAQAEAATKVGGLIEPLRFIELDEIKNTALLRSEKPAKRSNALSYFEVVVAPTAVALRRYQKANDKARREQVGFALTHESLAKVAEDLAKL